MKSGFMIGKSRDQCYILVSDWLPAWWASYNTEIVSYLHPARFQCGPANDPGPQMIPVPPMIPKLDLKRSQDRKWFLQMVSQKKSRMAWTPWIVHGCIFSLIVLNEDNSTMKYGKIVRDCINGSFTKHSAKINLNPGRWLLVYLSCFPVSDRYLRLNRHGHEETFLILSTVIWKCIFLHNSILQILNYAFKITAVSLDVFAYRLRRAFAHARDNSSCTHCGY